MFCTGIVMHCDAPCGAVMTTVDNAKCVSPVESINEKCLNLKVCCLNYTSDA